jgi:deoxyribose-phosphate aldolase
MVINLGDLKDKNYEAILDEIKAIKAACGDKILKVIIETCLLTEEEKVTMCEIVTNAAADYIKTSTGFSTGGANEADLRLFAANVGKAIKIKAAGGIKNLETAELFLEIGASRLGTSSMINIIKNAEVKGY